MNLNFEWDEEKAEANIIKHGISFQTAAKVFLDENRIEIYKIKYPIDFCKIS